jgi:hypothetical protein
MLGRRRAPVPALTVLRKRWLLEAILVYRGHPRLTSAQRHQLQQWELDESKQLIPASEIEQ